MELKPCPFCGGEARVKSFPHNYAVYCEICGATTQKYAPTKEMAIKAWNRRTDNG